MHLFPMRARAAAAVLAVACLPAVAACGTAADGANVAAHRPAVAPPPPPPTLPPPVSGSARTAAAGPLVAQGKGVRVERVRLEKSVSVAGVQNGKPLDQVFRITVYGRFQVRNMPLTIIVGDAPAGQAVENGDLRSAVVALPDSSRIKDGVKVSYRYGNAPATLVGTLKLVRR